MKTIINISASMIAISTILLILAYFLYGCGPQPAPPVNPEAGTEEDCPDACRNMERLRCPGWEGSPGEDEVFGTEDDVPCVEACIELMTADETVTLFPRCTAQANSCEEVEECFEGGY